MTATLAAEKLLAGYGKVPVVRELDIEIGKGELVALLGRNGSGKTTTLLTLAGVLAPLGGRIIVDGQETKLPLYRRAQAGLSLVMDDKSIFPALTVRENLRLGRSTVDDVVELFPELVPLLDKAAGLLSGGEQQMLSVGRALACHPEVFLGDELSLGLAPLVVKRLLAAVRKAADEGTAVLLVEQHARLVLPIADRAYVLQNGRVVLSGTGKELRERIREVESAYLAEPD